MHYKPEGGKVLKVRWALPGSGKSGSLRLVVVACCDEKRVQNRPVCLDRSDRATHGSVGF